MNKKYFYIILSNFLALSAGAQVAYYPFNGNTNDSSGGGHSLINSSVTFGADKNGTPNSAASFNGLTSWLHTNNFIAGKDSVSFSMWVKSNSSSQKGALIYVGNSNSNGFGMVLDKCNTLNNGDNVSPLCGGIRWLCDTSVHLTAAAWVHLALVKAGNVFKLYMNGVMTHNDTSSSISPSDYFLIGGNIIVPPGNSFNGMIDEVKIYDYALTVTQVNQLYSGVTNLSEPVSDVALYPNPVHSNQKLHISSLSINLNACTLHIYSLQGELIRVTRIENNEASIGETISEGVYLINIFNQDRTVNINRKLIILAD